MPDRSSRRDRLDALIRPFGGLNTAFFAVMAIMAAHEGEHFAQVMQKDVTLERCPEDCRGVLGFAFDIEEVHFAYNSGLWLALGVLFVAYRMWERRWRRAAPVPWVAMALGVFVVQTYHVVEHSAKLEQWFSNGRKSPTPGLIGKALDPPRDHNFSLIELHFTFNTVVFALVVFAYFGFGFHRHVFAGRRLPAWVPAGAVVVPLAASTGIAWATQTPTVRLAAGVHDGPIVVNRAEKLVGEDGAVVRGGIVVKASGVIVRDLTVEGGEHGIQIDGAKGVVLDGVRVRGAALDGINVRRGSARIYDCVIEQPGSRYTQGIDVSFTMDMPPSLVTGCRISGGQEGIVTHMAVVEVKGNHVRDTTMRGITMTEMSMGSVRKNRVENALGVGIYCGDYSHCHIAGNTVRGTRPDRSSGDLLRDGVGILAQFGATAELGDNELVGNPRQTNAFSNAVLERDE